MEEDVATQSAFVITNLTESDSCDSLPYWVRRPEPPTLAGMTPSESMLFLPVRDLGKVQAHQVMGTPEDLFQEASRRGLEQFPGLTPPELTPPQEVLLRQVSDSEMWRPLTEDRPASGDRPLRQWHHLLTDRRRQERLLTARTRRPPQALCMHSGGDFGLRSQRYLHDTLAYGPEAARPVGTAFWRLPSRFGGELHGLQETLTERVRQQRRRATVSVHVPAAIREERGTAPLPGQETAASAGPYHRHCRPHSPDDDPDLIVLGRAVLPDSETEPPEEQQRPQSPAQTSVSDGCSEGDEAPPGLTLAGHRAVYRPAVTSARTEPAVLASVSLSAGAGRLCRRYLPLANAGRVAIHYSWRAVARPNHFSGRPAPPVFFFDSGPGVVLPGRVLQLPVVFYAGTAGLYSEAWDLVTTPTLEAGAPVRLQLFGLAGLQDPYGADRHQLQATLDRRVAEAAAEHVLELLLRRATLSEEVPPAPQPVNTLQVRFVSSNAGLNYRLPVVQQLMQLHQDVLVAQDPPEKHTSRRRRRQQSAVTRPPWDLSCAHLKEAIMSLEYGEVRSELLRRLYELVEPLWHPPEWPPPTSATTVVRSGLLIVIQRFSESAADLEQRLGIQRVTAGGSSDQSEQPGAATPSPASAKRSSRASSSARDRKRRSPKKGSSAGAEARGRAHGSVTPTAADSNSSVADSDAGASAAGAATQALAPAVQARLRRGLYAIMWSLLSDFLEDITEPLEAVAKPPDEFLITDAMCGSQRQ